ncbi:hypothetical protein ACF0H5_022589 [Mactra antiquata]
MLYVFCLVFVLVTNIDLIEPSTTTCCKDGWLAYKGSCYMFYDENKVDWMEAVRYCKLHGSEIVVIESRLENIFLKYYARKLFNGKLTKNTTLFWLGASDSDIEGIWKWIVTDEELTYFDPNFMGDKTPDNHKDCLAMPGSYDFDWRDVPCTERLGYAICEIRASTDNNGTQIQIVGR